MSKRDREGPAVGHVGPPRPDVGPAAPPEKKEKKLEFQDLYLAGLPNQSRYETSFMHADHVTHTLVTNGTDFVVTGSADGRVKFWKKKSVGIEFVKLFRAHVGPIAGMSASPDGRLLARFVA
jgi:peptidylprolyl isomerase domain and WD repeat-containing protein 1